MSLCELIASGQLDEATRVAKKKKSHVNKLDGNGVAPLHVALRSGYEEFARFLVEKCKADAALRSKDGDIPLFMAAENGDWELTGFMASRCSCAVVDDLGNNVLHIVAPRTDIDMLSMHTLGNTVLGSGCQLNKANNEGSTPLHLAATVGNEPLVMFLANQKGLNVNDVNRDGLTAVQLAARQSHKSVVGILLGLQCDVSSLSSDVQAGFLATEIIELFNNRQLNTAGSGSPSTGSGKKSKKEKKEDPKISAFVAAVAEGKEGDIAKMLRKDGKALMKKRTLNGASLIHILAAHGAGGLVGLALDPKLKADINAQDNEGNTPLHIASRLCTLDVITQLLSNNADPNIPNGEGLVPLQYLIRGASGPEAFKLVQLLRAKGANFAVQDSGGNNLLHAAVQAQNAELVGILPTMGVDINEQNNEGLTPLRIAARSGYTQCCSILFGMRADVGGLQEDIKDGVLTPEIVEMFNQKTGQKLRPASYLVVGSPNSPGRELRGSSDISSESSDSSTGSKKSYRISKLFSSKGSEPSSPTVSPGRTSARTLSDNKSPREQDLPFASILATKTARDVARFLKKHGKQLASTPLESGETPLMHAAEHGNQAVVGCLVEKYKVPLDDVFEESTAVSRACDGGHFGVVDYLVSKGASLTAHPSLDKSSLLHIVVHAHQLNTSVQDRASQCLRTLVSKGISVDSRNIRGETPLYLSAKFGCLQFVCTLLELGASIDAPDENKRSPLAASAVHGHKEVVEYLLKNGASKDWFTPESSIAKKFPSDIREILSAAVEGEDDGKDASLHHAIGVGSISEIRRHVKANGLKVLEQVDESTGYNALHTAVYAGQPEIVETLLQKYPVNPNTPARDGTPPIILAALRSLKDVGRASAHIECLMTLLDNGAKPGTSSPCGKPLPHILVERPHPDATLIHKAFKSLLERKVDIDVTDGSGNTALHVAVEHGNEQGVMVLLNSKANINAENAFGETALQIAARKDEEGIVRILLGMRANTRPLKRDLHHGLLSASMTRLIRERLELREPNMSKVFNGMIKSIADAHEERCSRVNRTRSESIWTQSKGGVVPAMVMKSSDLKDEIRSLLKKAFGKHAGGESGRLVGSEPLQYLLFELGFDVSFADVQLLFELCPKEQGMIGFEDFVGGFGTLTSLLGVEGMKPLEKANQRRAERKGNIRLCANDDSGVAPPARRSSSKQLRRTQSEVVSPRLISHS